MAARERKQSAEVGRRARVIVRSASCVPVVAIGATLEEMQRTHEEPQSANGELATSKEELQSRNAELLTTNAEQISRMVSLTQVRRHMNNLLISAALALRGMVADADDAERTGPPRRTI